MTRLLDGNLKGKAVKAVNDIISVVQKRNVCVFFNDDK